MLLYVTDNSSLSSVKSTDHHIGYCRTEENIVTLTYTWEITNFWDVYQMMLPIYTGYVDSQYVQFRLDFDSEKQNLDLYLISTHNHIGICRVFLKNNQPNFYKTINIADIGDQTEFLCSIPIILLLKDTTEYLSDNTLTIYFECEWHNGISQKTMCTKISESYIKLPEDTSTAVFDQESLVTFIIGDERLYANKNVICAKSIVFQSMLNCQVKESVNEVKITDVEYDILKLLLSYMQFCFIPNLNVENIEILSDLLIAADKYDVQDLKILCELHLIKLVNIENYAEILTKVCLNDTKYLEKYIVEFIQVQPKCIFKPEMTKLIETNSASLLHSTKHTKTQAVLSCDIKTNSSTTIRITEVPSEQPNLKSPKKASFKYIEI